VSEVVIPRGRDHKESVYDFAQRRLGERFAQLFLDPMVSGIYGGDAKSINMQAAFPRIHQLEVKYGSLFKAMYSLRKQGGTDQNHNMGMPKGTLTSFQNGVKELIAKLFKKYQGQIKLH